MSISESRRDPLDVQGVGSLGSEPVFQDGAIDPHETQAEILPPTERVHPLTPDPAFIDPTRAGVPPSVPSTRNGPVCEGAQLGDYLIQRLIGRGGMGYVYEAIYKRLAMPVALKMIDVQGAAAAADVERFIEEAQAVAKLHKHPNIVKIYNIHEGPGNPYFVMQLIRGGSLKDRLAEFQADPRRVAELMVTVAEAIAHAHRRGILHRDLKPDNILIDEEGTPYVTDFGLVKRVDPTEGGTITVGLLPRPARDSDDPSIPKGFESSREDGNSILGTPSFMPPEQAEGRSKDVSTLSDVYGLGSTFFALLTGRAPFEGSGVHDILNKVIAAPTPSPRAFNPGVDRDLDAVCMKCMAKTPANRYESAEALVRDLKRYLDGKPVHARPLPWWDRAARWVRREPMKVAAAASILGLLGLTGLLLLQSHRGQLERLENQLNVKERELSDALTDRTLRSASQAIHDLVEKFDGSLGTDRSHAVLRKTILQDALDYFEGVIAVHDDNAEESPFRRLERAKAHRYVADLAWRLDDQQREETEPNYRRAIEILDTLIQDDEIEAELRHGIQAELGTAHHEFGIYLSDRGDAEGARTHFRRGLEVRELLPKPCSNPEHRELGGRACGCEGSFEDRTELARSHGYLGDRYLADGQLKAAVEEYEISNRIREKLFDECDGAEFGDDRTESNRWKATIQYARSCWNLAWSDLNRGDPQRAIPRLERGIRELRDLRTADPEDCELRADLADDLKLLAEVRFEAEQRTGAMQDVEESIQLYDRLIERKPGVPKYGIQRAAAEVVAATILLEGGHVDQVTARCEQIREHLAEIEDLAENLSQYRQTRARSRILLGRIALMQDDAEAALEPLSSARSEYLALLQRDENNSDYLSEQAEAMAYFAQALGPENPRTSSLLSQAVEIQESLHKRGFQSLRFEDRLMHFREMQVPERTVASGS